MGTENRGFPSSDKEFYETSRGGGDCVPDNEAKADHDIREVLAIKSIDAISNCVSKITEQISVCLMPELSQVEDDSPVATSRLLDDLSRLARQVAILSDRISI